ncbi:MAG: hypothetical protein EOO38_21355 [Cytophagaceae bacterium]|nr:MAG: hypothetical protein EOO38_21355 [Cytophagaceae bacterium]
MLNLLLSMLAIGQVAPARYAVTVVAPSWRAFYWTQDQSRARCHQCSKQSPEKNGLNRPDSPSPKLLNLSSMEAYCMKCKEKREAIDVEAVTMKNGKPAQQGKCPVCGTKMFKIGAPK